MSEKPPTKLDPTCDTHGDPLICLACEQEEDARPEWRVALSPSTPSLSEQQLWDKAREVVQGFRAKVATGEITELAAVNAAMGITEFVQSLYRPPDAVVGQLAFPIGTEKRRKGGDL